MTAAEAVLFIRTTFKWFHASLFAIPLKQDRRWQPQWLVNVAGDEKDNRVWRNAGQLAVLALQEQEPSVLAPPYHHHHRHSPWPGRAQPGDR